MLFFLLFLATSAFAEFSQIHCYALSDSDRTRQELIWESSELAPFNELILTWNATRPEEGRYSFFISLYQNGQWSPWLYSSEWGDLGQIIFNDAPEDSFAVTYRDGAKPKKGFATGFRIRVLAAEVADLFGMKTLWVNLCDLTEFQPTILHHHLDSILLQNVPRQSQITLRHPRSLDLSFPAAMSTAINALFQKKAIDPIDFANQVMDNDTDFYESWMLNAAEAAHRLGADYQVRVERLADFETLHSYLLQGSPVLIAMKGSLPGSPRLYRFPHILCVIGYNSDERKVYCIDSGFPNDKSTFVGYSIEDFLKCWNTQKNIACVFLKISP